MPPQVKNILWVGGGRLGKTTLLFFSEEFRGDEEYKETIYGSAQY